jgi:starch phosphorylase
MVRAFVSLGELSPEDVDVQLVHGRADAEDNLTETTVASLRPVEAYEGNRHRFDGEVTLGVSGPFGYTVRVVPRNLHLNSPAELGVVALP